MLSTYLKAKVQEIYVTGCKVEYKGSLTLDEDIMDAMGVAPYEQVFVHSKYHPSRIMTYFLPGKRGSKICELNGGAAHFFREGELVHLLVFAQSETPITPIVI